MTHWNDEMDFFPRPMSFAEGAATRVIGSNSIDMGSAIGNQERDNIDFPLCPIRFYLSSRAIVCTADSWRWTKTAQPVIAPKFFLFQFHFFFNRNRSYSCLYNEFAIAAGSLLHLSHVVVFGLEQIVLFRQIAQSRTTSQPRTKSDWLRNMLNIINHIAWSSTRKKYQFYIDDEKYASLHTFNNWESVSVKDPTMTVKYSHPFSRDAHQECE